MAKSKKRGGEKAHRKRLNQRNQGVKLQMKKQQQMFVIIFVTMII
jgi:hypothetical protein